MSAVTVYTKFLPQVIQLLLSSLRGHHPQALISIWALVLTRFANLFKAPLMLAEKQDEREVQYYACCSSCFSAGMSGALNRLANLFKHQHQHANQGLAVMPP